VTIALVDTVTDTTPMSGSVSKRVALRIPGRPPGLGPHIHDRQTTRHPSTRGIILDKVAGRSLHLAAIRCSRDTGHVGYRAPSADEIYRRAFRLDGPVTLTDRFGFSIVLVNDQSPTCRVFLRRYCVDLCLRTADRVRFVFFSDLPAGRFDVLTESGRRPRGLLRRVIASITGNIDSEDDLWAVLRPSGFTPFQDIDEIERALSYECDSQTAMPGAGSALEFAQRIGIGAFVPCVVAFSEIGEQHVHVLPISDKSPETVFAHLRGWIDDFYASNRLKIEQWRRIEGEITQLAADTQQTLSDVRTWREKRLTQWRALAFVSSAIHSIEADEPSRWKLLITSSFSDVPASVNMALCELHDAEKLSKQAVLDLSSLEPMCRSMTEAVDYAQVVQAVVACKKNLSPHLRSEGLASAITGLDSLQRTPLNQVRHWWIEAQSDFPLSAKRFPPLRDWRKIAAGLGLDARAERRDLIDTLRECRLFDNPNAVVTQVLRPLAASLKMHPEDDQFVRLVSPLRSELESYATRMIKCAPPWILDLAPSLTFGDAFPIGENLPLAENWYVASNIESFAKLRKVTESATLSYPTIRHDLAIQARDAIVRELKHRAANITTEETIYRTARSSTLALLQPLRRRLADDALSMAGQVLVPPNTPTPELLTRLHEALDDYNSTINQIEFPYVLDPETIEVPVAMPLVRAAHLDQNNRERDARHSFERKLDMATQAGQECAAAQARAQEEVTAASPTERIVRALMSIKPSVPVQMAIREMTPWLEPSRAAELIGSLSRDELSVVADALDCERRQADILVALGLYASGQVNQGSRLVNHINRDDFDVFMAHNSCDKPGILSVARSLRDRGVYPWIDFEQIPPGQWAQDTLQLAIPRCRTAAIFIGPNGLGQWEKLELRTFVSQCVERQTPVIPVLLPSVDELPPSLLFLRELSMVKFIDSFGDEQALARLVWGITGERPAQAI
jgi:hypothetical protein